MRKITHTLLTLSLFFLAACMTTSSSEYQSQMSSAVEWKGELFVDLTISNITGKEEGKLVFEFFDNVQMDGQPTFVFAVPINSLSEESEVKLSYDFIDLANGIYYLRIYLDENLNGIFDGGEISGIHVQESGEPSPITIEVSTRQAISLRVE